MPRTHSQFGPYQLLYPLGAGGMGEVFLARHQGEHGIQRMVAIKLMLARQRHRQHNVDLFLDEVRIASQLNHGNIVQVVDHGLIDDQYFMAMEYVHGENLLEVINRLYDHQEPMPLDLALHIGSGICQGLSYAHAKKSIDGRPLGIVHRDISPHNIMISFEGEVKIADFGVARAAEQTHETVGGELKGKLAYMSPEQAFGRPLDQRSDLFSLGTLLYEVVSGRGPFLRDNPMATLEAVRAAQVVSLAAVRPDLPGEVVELIHRALAPRPENRPDTARTMYEELQRIARLHTMSVSAFDLADLMAELFPESRPEATTDQAGATAVGRRADATAPDVEQLEQRTVHYLQQRRPQPPAPSGDGETAAVVQQVHRRRGLWVAGASALLLVAAGWFGVRLWSASDAPTMDGGAAPDVTTLDASLRDVAVHPDRGRPSPDSHIAGPSAARLVVRSHPIGAWVTVGGRHLPGTTPLRATVPAGRQTCTVGLAGHESLHQTIVLRSGQTFTLQATLQPLPARLEVTSTHGCRVQINGKTVGATPLQGHTVAPGRLIVGCIDPASGLLDLRRTTATPGQTVRLRFRFGSLAVNVQPWAQVSIDGRGRGPTPLMLLLPVGDHRVTLSNPQQNLTGQRTVEIRESATTRISSW